MERDNGLTNNNERIFKAKNRKQSNQFEREKKEKKKKPATTS